MRARTSAWLAALFAFVAAPAVCAQDTANILGQVRLVNGSFPPERVMVTLQTRGLTITSAYTDNEGRFAFYDLISNPYHVVVNHEGFQPFHEVINVNPLISPNFHVRVILRPIEKGPSDVSVSRPGANPHLVDAADYRRKFPREAVKEYDAGVKADAQGKPDKALAHYEKAVRLAPDFYLARNNLGSKYLAKGDFTAAEKEFTRVIELSPNYTQAYLNLGNLYFLARRNDEALRSLEEGLRRDPNSAFAHCLRGAVLARAARFPEAEAALRRALELDPQLPRVRIELATLFLQQQKKSDAIRELRTFVELFPANPMLPKVKELLAKLESAPPSS